MATSAAQCSTPRGVADHDFMQSFGRIAADHEQLGHGDEVGYAVADGRDARDGVTAHKLAGTVHGTIELGLLSHLGAARLGGQNGRDEQMRPYRLIYRLGL